MDPRQQLRYMTATLAEFSRTVALANELSVMRSPLTPRRNVMATDGISRPVEETVLCPRRQRVADELRRVTRDPEVRHAVDILRQATERLTQAIDAWDDPHA